jgi:hypothetical protein
MYIVDNIVDITPLHLQLALVLQSFVATLLISLLRSCPYYSIVIPYMSFDSDSVYILLMII